MRWFVGKDDYLDEPHLHVAVAVCHDSMTSLSLLTLSVVFQLIEAIERDFPSIERNWLSSPRIYLMTPSPICAAHFLIRRTKTSGKPRPTRSDNFVSFFSKLAGSSGGDQSGRIISSHSIIEELARSNWMGLSGGESPLVTSPGE